MFFRKLETVVGHMELLGAYLNHAYVYAHIYTYIYIKILHCKIERDLFVPL